MIDVEGAGGQEASAGLSNTRPSLRVGKRFGRRVEGEPLHS